MERNLYFGALALGLAAWVCSLLLAPHRVNKDDGQFAGEWIPPMYGAVWRQELCRSLCAVYVVFANESRRLLRGKD